MANIRNLTNLFVFQLTWLQKIWVWIFTKRWIIGQKFLFLFLFCFHFFYLTNKNWFRMEKLTLRSRITQAKIIGAIVSISGALLVVLYKGPAMFLTSPSTHSKPLLQWPLCISLSNWVTGGFLLIAQCLLNSIWYILQV